MKTSKESPCFLKHWKLKKMSNIELFAKIGNGFASQKLISLMFDKILNTSLVYTKVINSKIPANLLTVIEFF